MSRLTVALAASLGLTASTGVAYAHFALTKPVAYSQQDDNGLPQKSAPCGQADPGIALVPTNLVTWFHEGDTIDEKAGIAFRALIRAAVALNTTVRVGRPPARPARSQKTPTKRPQKASKKSPKLD